MGLSHKYGSDQEDLLHHKLQAILKICQRINSERDLDSLLDLVAREAIALLEADRASIFLLDSNRKELWSKVALGSSDILRFDASRGIAGVAATSGETVNVTNAYGDPRFNPSIDDRTGYRTETLLAVPLQKFDGEIVGAFEVLNKRHGVFTDEDVEVLKSLAAQAAIALQTTQFIAELTRNRMALEQENAQLWREVETRFSGHNIVGNSPRIQSVLRLIERIRDSTVNVLIGGESGTGKELIAKAIHYSSLRVRKPFVALNCAALPETLVESELFGIEKGVATGVNPRIGHFQAADGGTLFLDEIGDLSLAAQAKILRALQERVIERVGGRQAIPVDVRVLAASNKDLEAEIRQGKFREDLYYRLRVIHIVLPSLREIREDIPLLAQHFLGEYSHELSREGLEFSPGLVRRLREQPWPGNVRQLQNEIKRLIACARHNVITEDDLMEGLPDAAPAPPSARGGAQKLKNAIEHLERNMIAETLESTGYNQQKTARLLGLSRQGLINKMKRFGLQSAGAAGA
jgi:Nif-specific regulatory protein